MPVKYTHFVIAERGHQKNAAKPPRPAQTGWLVPKEIVVEFERTTPSAPFKGTGIFLDGASTPPLPRSIQSCPAGQRQNTQETAPRKQRTYRRSSLRGEFRSPHSIKSYTSQA